MKRILVLFPKDWDREALSGPKFRGRYEFVFEGFDLFSFPQNAALLTFDVFRFVERIVERYRTHRLDGVFSNNEHFGALIAAVVAKRLGLPGSSPLAVIDCQHKFYSRVRQRNVLPQATPRFAVFPYAVRDAAQIGLPFPFYVKPVKATYSVLARRVDDFAELRQHLRFRAVEKLVIRKLVRPFNDLMRAHTDYAIDAHHMIAEEVLAGVQVNVDGFVHDGNITILGFIDEVMYPGTQAFMRFEYPSRLPPAVLRRMESLTRALMRGMGFDFGFFNVELTYDPATGAIRIIEINPRLASQLANLYRRVDGYDPYDLLIAMSLGEEPTFERGHGEFGAAASFIFRRFDGRPVTRVPSSDQIRSLREVYPDARLMLYLKKGASLAREMKWLGSYRYAVLNLGGDSAHDLHDRFRRIRRQLAFDAE
jgi:biotin carboxylase